LVSILFVLGNVPWVHDRVCQRPEIGLQWPRARQASLPRNSSMPQAKDPRRRGTEMKNARKMMATSGLGR
jgi:hypothetical protein